MDITLTENQKNEYRKSVDINGTIRHLKKMLDGKWQLHNVDDFAYIPEGDRKKAEYHINGIKYTKDQFKAMKKDSNGLPWYKGSSAKARF